MYIALIVIILVLCIICINIEYNRIRHLSKRIEILEKEVQTLQIDTSINTPYPGFISYIGGNFPCTTESLKNRYFRMWERMDALAAKFGYTWKEAHNTHVSADWHKTPPKVKIK